MKSLHLVNAKGSSFNILNDIANISCLNVLEQAEVLSPGELQEIHTTSLSFSGCGTGASHDNCTVTAETLGQKHTRLDIFSPPLRLLLLWLDGVMSVSCTILGFVKIDCTYDESLLESVVESASKETGHGLVRTEESFLEASGGELCPEETSIDSVLESLEDIYASE